MNSARQKKNIWLHKGIGVLGTIMITITVTRSSSEGQRAQKWCGWKGGTQEHGTHSCWKIWGGKVWSRCTGTCSNSRSCIQWIHLSISISCVDACCHSGRDNNWPKLTRGRYSHEAHLFPSIMTYVSEDSHGWVANLQSLCVQPLKMIPELLAKWGMLEAAYYAVSVVVKMIHIFFSQKFDNVTLAWASTLQYPVECIEELVRRY